MKRKFRRKRKDNKGFTLVELVIVIAILAILVGLLAPQYTKYVERTRMTADAENLNEMVKAFQVAVADQDVNVPVTKVGYYMISITGNGTTFYGDEEINEKSVGGDYGELYGTMCETLGGDWLSTPLKSGKWSNEIIYAFIYYGEDGSVSVDYRPAQLKQITTKLNGEE